MRMTSSIVQFGNGARHEPFSSTSQKVGFSSERKAEDDVCAYEKEPLARRNRKIAAPTHNARVDRRTLSVRESLLRLVTIFLVNSDNNYDTRSFAFLLPRTHFQYFTKIV